MAIIRIKNLLIRTYIGFNPEELVNKQDVIINLTIEVKIPSQAIEQDEPIDIYDYKKVTKQMIAYVQDGRFKLLEVLTGNLLEMVLTNPLVVWARIEVDKPHALRFAESVSVEMEQRKKDQP